MQHRSVIDKEFDATIERVLSDVSLLQVVKMGVKSHEGSTMLDDFKPFSLFFRAHKDPVTGSVDNKFVGDAVCRIMNKHWKDERFYFEQGDLQTYVDIGEFQFTFRGSAHIIRLHAYIDTEQTGRHGSVYKVDVNVDQNFSPGFFLICCPWCDPVHG